MFAKFKELREEREGGFTLIELLVVILIIGILAAIAIPMFLNQRKSAVDAQVQSDVKNAATNIETWMVKNPSTAVPALDGTPANSGADQAAIAALAAGAAKDAYGSVKLSSNTKIIVKSSGVGTYTICGFNAGGDQSASNAKAVTYDSNGGGIKSGVACP